MPAPEGAVFQLGESSNRSRSHNICMWLKAAESRPWGNFPPVKRPKGGNPAVCGSPSGKESADSVGVHPSLTQVVNAIVSWEPVKMSGYKLECPAPIVAMRAALARTPPVRVSQIP